MVKISDGLFESICYQLADSTCPNDLECNKENKRASTCGIKNCFECITEFILSKESEKENE